MRQKTRIPLSASKRGGGRHKYKIKTDKDVVEEA
jgi:hypothetical protein